MQNENDTQRPPILNLVKEKKFHAKLTKEQEQAFKGELITAVYKQMYANGMFTSEQIRELLNMRKK